MAVTGQFGRALTGSGSMASAIAGIATEFVTLRINRIYSAFINEEALDGSVVDAQVAIRELQKLMAGTTADTRTGQDITEMIRAVRKAARTRTLNKFDAQLVEGGAEKGDYGKMVTAIQEMLLDPTLNPDDIVELRKELGAAVDNFLNNSQKQFGAGGKITVNGQVIDFTDGKNEDQFLALFDKVASANPDMADKIIRQKYEAEASVAVVMANREWLASTRTTDSQKLDGYTSQLVILRAAYKKLQDAGLGSGDVGTGILDDIRTIEGYQTTVKGNIGQKAVNTRVVGMNKEVFGDLYDIEDALIAMGVQLPEAGIAGLLLNNANYAYELIDMAIAMNGGSTTITVNGKEVDVDRESIYSVISDTKAAAVSANAWAKNNPSVSASDKATIRGYVTTSTALFNNVPNLKLEDAYDNARVTLETALDANPDDINARINALKAFGKAIRGLAGTTSNTAIKTGLLAEADMFETGKVPTGKALTYGEWSGNFRGGAGGESALAVGSDLGQLINPRVDGGDVSISEAIALLYGQHASFNSGEGTVYIDGVTGERIATASPEDISAYDNGQGMVGLTNVTNTFGGVTATTQHAAVYARYRIVGPGFGTNTTDAALNDATVGWVSIITDDKGNPIEAVLFYADKNSNSQSVIKRGKVDEILALIGATMNNIPLRNVGNNSVVVANSAFVSALRNTGADWNNSYGVDVTDMNNPESDFWAKLGEVGGYASVQKFDDLETSSFYKLIKAGKIKATVIDGEVKVWVNGGGSGRDTKWNEITTMLNGELLSAVSDAVTLIQTNAPPPGEAPGGPGGQAPAPEGGGGGIGGGAGGMGGSGATSGTLPASLIAKFEKEKRDRLSAEAERRKRLAAEFGDDSYVPNKGGVVRTAGTTPVPKSATAKLDGYAAIETARENNALLGTFMRNVPTTSSTPLSSSGSVTAKKIQGVERVSRKAL